MNYLLDTHILIWFITEDPKLKVPLEKIIKNKNHKCFTSIASLWEICIKSSINKLELKSSLDEIFNIIRLSDIEIIPITPVHLLLNATLKLHHRDPFDRIIIAQAQVENMMV